MLPLAATFWYLPSLPLKDLCSSKRHHICLVRNRRMNGGQHFPLTYSLEQYWSCVLSDYTCSCICHLWNHLFGSMGSQCIFDGVSGFTIFDCNENSEKGQYGHIVGEWNRH